MNLCSFERPSRYINNEVNSIHKHAVVKFALAFPDIYDIGMSHLGLKILYKIINDLPYASAERVFSPWTDMEAEMKAKGIPLCSLETKRPLRDFDIVGFSLQYELSYTTVLNMLHMSGIPLRSEHRSDKNPLVIAGGPCTANPMPMAAFIDAFLIGDAEDAVKEITDTVLKWKTQGNRKRESLLHGLAEISGVFVPACHGPEFKIKKRFIESLDEAPYPVAPVVPYTPVIHDRINIELSRGCTMGCRFCQAGMTYRPLRERSPERILRIAEESLKNTGHGEVSLTSLSAGDYTQLLPLVREFNRRFSGRKVSVSLPSLRVGAVNQDVLKEIKAVMKTGFTIAPEAATERLRASINKDFNEEAYEKALDSLFSEGWENIKLYFMVGLPTEKDEDVEAIPEMAMKALRTAKKYTRRHVNINVGISPFVPKPHTPMQWCGQEDIGKIREKMGYLRRSLSRKGLAFKGHNTDMSLLEAVFSRGDRKLSDLIEKAWALGCRLDAWTEVFDFTKWLRAAEMTGTDMLGYAQKQYDTDSRLPWDNIDTGIKKEFMLKELQKTSSCDITKDCRNTCYACGLGCRTAAKTAGEITTQGPVPGVRDLRESITDLNPAARPAHPALRVRVEFSKTGDMRYLSHRELMTSIMRALRRAGIPLLYSQGFHPSPKISFGPPLNVGVSGLREYFDLEIEQDGRPLSLSDLLPGLREGIKVNNAAVIPRSEPSLDSFISGYEYVIIYPGAGLMMEDFLLQHSMVVSRKKENGKITEVDIRQMITDAHAEGCNAARFTATDCNGNKVRIGELASAIFHVQAEELIITRQRMFGWRNGWVEPLYCSVAAFGHESKDLETEGASGRVLSPQFAG